MNRFWRYMIYDKNGGFVTASPYMFESHLEARQAAIKKIGNDYEPTHMYSVRRFGS